MCPTSASRTRLSDTLFRSPLLRFQPWHALVRSWVPLCASLEPVLSDPTCFRSHTAPPGPVRIALYAGAVQAGLDRLAQKVHCKGGPGAQRGVPGRRWSIAGEADTVAAKNVSVPIAARGRYLTGAQGMLCRNGRLPQLSQAFPRSSDCIEAERSQDRGSTLRPTCRRCYSITCTHPKQDVQKPGFGRAAWVTKAGLCRKASRF